MAENRSSRRDYSSDMLARKLLLAVMSDYRYNFGDSRFLEKYEHAFNSDINSFRDFVFPSLGIVEPHRYKFVAQVENLLKKYRFANDKFTDSDLQTSTLDKFLGEQVRILQPRVRSITTHMVLQQARKLARTILGKFNVTEVVNNSRFGKKSSIGCPLASAYLDIKLSSSAAFTGSSSCSKVFFNNLEGDPILSEIVSNIERQKGNLEYDKLHLICVPKSWKTHRLITPLTLLALFYSNGFGGVVTKRLTDFNLNISKLQARHRSLVQRMSCDLKHATADLSSASDSITIELLNSILPRDWFVALKPLFCHTVLSKDSENTVRSFYSASVLPMGNGATFPLETLIFYCLIKAIGTLTGIHGTYSVYGDDLIYPSHIHKYVSRIFKNLGLVMNLDKTFVKYPFRESCGSDFYRGIDVRSFYFEGTSVKLSKIKYEALLYKTYNGLQQRWSKEELPSTFNLLLNELSCVCKSILLVPPRYPDESGIKVPTPSSIPSQAPGLNFSHIGVKTDVCGNSKFKFACLVYTTERRVVRVVLPYYWLALQGLTDDLSDGYQTPEPFSLRSSLSWTRQRRIRFYIGKDGRKKKKILVSFIPTVDSRTGGRHKLRYESTSEWI